ncbi:hypothetical protein FBU31_006994, partial [Coemansia sp. 'formosensis']
TVFKKADAGMAHMAACQYITTKVTSVQPETLFDDDWKNLSNGVSGIYNMGNYFIK